MFTCKASIRILVEPASGSFPAVYKTVFLCWSEKPSINGKHWFITDDTSNSLKMWLVDAVAETIIESAKVK